VAISLGAVTVGYYLLALRQPGRVLDTGHEYFSFIALIGSLFVVSGGIHITIKGEATPRENVVFLLFGAITANFLGTTGASMLLIRPWLRMNKYRVTAHHVVFFIFIVSNVGGCLTPIGDPPLFLGYLKGVPFWWVTMRCLPMWATGVGLLLALFYLVDRRNYRRAPKSVRDELAEPPDEWHFRGLPNLLFLAMILGAVFIKHPPFLREGVMIAAALGSLLTTPHAVREANDFNFHPIREVAVLFIGIFATMMPALDWLEANADRFGTPSPATFYWASGSLSSVLDNAPTYLSFLSASYGTLVPDDVVTQIHQLAATGGEGLTAVQGAHADLVHQTYASLQEHFAGPLASGHLTTEQIQMACLLGTPSLARFILAISIGAVFFGANTYIGNGPNFMVKSIADHARVQVPGFLGYIFRYTLPIMLPVLVVVWLLFF
jgi:Na+/H+ antiporter NhaD/arsenite permease-like protein